MERVAVERELGSGQGDIMTRIPNSNHTWSSGIGSLFYLVLVLMFWQFPNISRIVVIFIPKHQVVVHYCVNIKNPGN